jgi:DNA-directed RNA polymerase specialized sigma24 family protein
MSNSSPANGRDRLDKFTSQHYTSLCDGAAVLLARERRQPKLEPCELVSLAYLRLVATSDTFPSEGDQCMAAFYLTMQRVLIDEGRRNQTLKRGEGWQRVEEDVSRTPEPSHELLTSMLDQLARRDECQAAAVHLRVVMGFSASEAATLLGIGERTVYRATALGCQWLRQAVHSW